MFDDVRRRLNDEDQRCDFAGTKTVLIRQIGNAVPVAAASALVRAPGGGRPFRRLKTLAPPTC
ncbi:MAG TPA: hypothetical protein VLX44_05155 [Xanthobacteraceae bacterium]|nr:hypothetical protein [Xanthobacteraceae bacterium]